MTNRQRNPGFDTSIVVIAGGASGIGRAIAYQLASKKATVIVANRKGDSLRSFQKEATAGSIVAQTYATDFMRPDDVQQLVDHVVKEHGRIDYFFNCVGIVQGGEVRDTPLATAQRVIDINIGSVINGTHYTYAQMVRQRHGHIVNIASAAGLLPTPLMPFYSASKFAIVGFSHALRAEAKAFGVDVSVVCPGFVKTPIYEKSFYDNLDKAKTIDTLFHRIPIQSPEAAARRIIHGVRGNRATIHTWYSLRLAGLFYRLFPNFYILLASQGTKIARGRLELYKNKQSG